MKILVSVGYFICVIACAACLFFAMEDEIEDFEDYVTLIFFAVLASCLWPLLLVGYFGYRFMHGMYERWQTKHGRRPLKVK